MVSPESISIAIYMIVLSAVDILEQMRTRLSYLSFEPKKI